MKLIQLVSNQDGELTYALDDQGQLYDWGVVKQAFGQPVYGFRPEIDNCSSTNANAVLNTLSAILVSLRITPDHPRGNGAKAEFIRAVCKAKGWDWQPSNNGYVLISAKEEVRIRYTKDIDVIEIRDHRVTYYLDLAKRKVVNEPT